MTNELMKNGLWQQAFKVSFPVAMGYIPAGIAFGVLFVAAKLPIWAAILSSVVLYAGAAQYASIALLAGGVGICFARSKNELMKTKWSQVMLFNFAYWKRVE